MEAKLMYYLLLETNIPPVYFTVASKTAASKTKAGAMSGTPSLTLSRLPYYCVSWTAELPTKWALI